MIDEDYFGDPELGDEDDPEYQKEMFLMFRSMGLKPEDLIDRKYAELYREWLKTTPPEDDDEE